MPYNDLRKGRVSLPGQAYHIVLTTRNRTPHFNTLAKGRPIVRQLLAINGEQRAETLCYSLMPDHLHWLMVLRRGELSEVVRLLKGRTSRAFGAPLWQGNYFDHALRPDEDIRALARYIVANPLRAGLVESVGDYSLWDTIWLD